MPAPYEQIFLFGDSITQQSYDQERGFGFSAALQNAYIRKLDVVNRGFSGYTTRKALKVLPHIIPSPDVARIRLLVVFFGANDASLPEAENHQHVPLDEYKTNLKTIITDPLVQAHEPKVVLVAPPPINEHLQWATDQTRSLKSVSRKAATTKKYAEAAVELGKELDIPVINLWQEFMAKAGWKVGEDIPGSLELPQNDALVELMHDGLHFNPAGYDVLFRGLMKVIGENWSELLPENLPNMLPLWNDDAGWKAWEAANKA
ncbi:SGNH hydrolase [Byssothecium circinans]|uniref:SGNH hydrolase n=1 Tax=Byssothecium circinans TaxID=147558 RepID=A0A6A5UD41_9PLEO|nr:SGNH hydrolase [Byssothecium circinans]